MWGAPCMWKSILVLLPASQCAVASLAERHHRGHRQSRLQGEGARRGSEPALADPPAAHFASYSNQTQFGTAPAGSASGLVPISSREGVDNVEVPAGLHASWAHVEASVFQSLTNVERRREHMQTWLDLLKRSCDIRESGCSERQEAVAAKLRQLTIAVAQLRQKEAQSRSVENAAKTASIKIAKIERQIEEERALEQFARLSQKETDTERERMLKFSAEYAKKGKEAQREIDALVGKLDVARSREGATEQAAFNFVADASGIGDSVNATDGFAAEQLSEANRKEHRASALFRRAKAMAQHAQRMMHFHTDAKKDALNPTTPPTTPPPQIDALEPTAETTPIPAAAEDDEEEEEEDEEEGEEEREEAVQPAVEIGPEQGQAFLHHDSDRQKSQPRISMEPEDVEEEGSQAEVENEAEEAATAVAQGELPPGAGLPGDGEDDVVRELDEDAAVAKADEDPDQGELPSEQSLAEAFEQGTAADAESADFLQAP